MKRELAYALEAQSQFTCFVGRTRSSKNLKSTEHVNNSVDRSNQCNSLHVYRRNKRFKNESADVDELKTPMCEEVESKVEIETKIDVPIVASVPTRRFTRSLLKQKEMEVEEGNLGNDDSKIDGQMVPSTPTISVLGATTTKKLELKMSKKIELNERPTTLRGLLQTGLLEGHSVFYKFPRKGINLRGVIKGVGILCSCSLCDGSTVISPSQFEIHACRSYRHARKFICFENGKSLLHVMKVCKRSALETLEDTIQTVIGLVPVKESSICQNCKSSFAPSSLVNVKQLCGSCINSGKVQAGPTLTTSDKSRTSKRVLVPKSSASAKLSNSSRKKNQQNLKRNTMAPWSPRTRRATECDVSQEKSQRKTKKSSRSVLNLKSPESASIGKLSQSKREGRISKRLSKSTSVPRPSKSATTCTSSQTKSQWKITKKDQRMHRLVFEEGGLPDGSEVAYYSRGKKLLEGYKKGYGIFCFCCNSEVSPSQFEAHAGWASRKKPYGYIYTSNGVSLHEYAISLLKLRKCTSKDNDDLCVICADGGNLLLCDGCPRAFHKECASLPCIPRGKWYCKYCQNMFQRERFVEHNANALAAGRVSGIDPIEQITQRCIRIVKNPDEIEAVACLLCRSYDYCKSGFGLRTVILCDQCEKEYHVGCLKKHNMADLKALPKGKWFCCLDCVRIHSVLQNLVTHETQKLPDTLMALIRGKQKDSGLDIATGFDVRWRLLNGQIASRETKLLLSEAVAIFHECFDPIIDLASGRDFIPSMVYGRSIRGQDFGGMCCAILTINSTVVSAGIIRIFGQDVAELPLVATSKCNQGKGYFQLLFSCIERLLSFLNIKRIVLPAADEAESIWTNKFGFKKIPPEQLSNYRKTCSQMITFKGTSMLEKVVSAYQTAPSDSTTFDISVESF